MNDKNVTYHPISAIPVIAHAIEGSHNSTKSQLGNMRRLRQASLDDATLNRVKKLYESEMDFFPYFTEQLRRWSELKNLTQFELGEVSRLSYLNEKTEEMAKEILEICEEYKDKTIDALLNKDDATLGMEFLMSRGLSDNPEDWGRGKH
jgi:hypothetical protein